MTLILQIGKFFGKIVLVPRADELVPAQPRWRRASARPPVPPRSPAAIDKEIAQRALDENAGGRILTDAGCLSAHRAPG
jgi:hypothetical protein